MTETDASIRLEFEREEDGRWMAEAPDLPGVLAYGTTKEEARARVEALALRVLADRLDHGEDVPAIRLTSDSWPARLA